MAAVAELPPSMRLTLLRMVRDIAPIMANEAAKQAFTHLGNDEQAVPLDSLPVLRTSS